MPDRDGAPTKNGRDGKLDEKSSDFAVCNAVTVLSMPSCVETKGDGDEGGVAHKDEEEEMWGGPGDSEVYLEFGWNSPARFWMEQTSSSGRAVASPYG